MAESTSENRPHGGEHFRGRGDESSQMGGRDSGDRGREGREGRGAGGRRPHRFHRGKVCSFCVDKVNYIDYKDLDRLRKYVASNGKILPRRMTGSCARHQRMLTVALKRARTIALLPYKFCPCGRVISRISASLPGGTAPVIPISDVGGRVRSFSAQGAANGSLDNRLQDSHCVVAWSLGFR
jgi:small subunit ribosomal protein S18